MTALPTSAPAVARDGDEIVARVRSRVTPLLETLYGPAVAAVAAADVEALAARFVADADLAPRPAPDQSTTVLITYGDTVRRPGEAPLVTLRRTLDDLVGPLISDVHLLPLHPSTSDDGFAVVDYDVVEPSLGTWADVHALGAERGLMLDFVANHVSASSPWFRGWLAGQEEYAGLFIEEDPAFDVAATTRPRTSPLFHTYSRPDGSTVRAWTTFSADQVDLNLADPATLLRLTGVLLDFVRHGARLIRLDAIGFLWKESGTTSMSLPGTHAVVRLWRALLDEVAPGVQIVTETNVPAPENASYFGSGDDEAHLVYQFALPPLVLHSFVAGDTGALSRWAAGVVPPGPRATFLTFLSSHDGIGLRGSEGILTDAERAALVERVRATGGAVSMRTGADGGQSVYELNTTFLDALAAPEELGDDAVVSAKGLAAHSVLLAVTGVPAIYVHSLFGSRNDAEAVRETGINRRISRAVLDADELAGQVAVPGVRRAMVEGLRRMLEVRAANPAFDPFGAHEVAALDPRVFAVRRRAEGGGSVLCVANVTGDVVPLDAGGVDLLTGVRRDALVLGPYEYVWLAEG